MSSSVHNMRPGHKPALKGLASLSVASLLALALLLLLNGGRYASGVGTELYVIQGGSGTACTVPADACSLDVALAVAKDGDKLLIAEGIHISSSPITKSLWLAGGYDVGFNPTDPATNRSIIQGAGSASLVYHGITNTVGTTLTLQGLYIQNSAGRGIEIALPPSPVVPQPIVRLEFNQVWLQNNVNVGGDGGGLYVDSSVFATVVVANSVISGNIAQNGGGLYLTARSTLSLDDTAVTSNSATAGGDGGGIYLNGVSNANITASSMFSANSAERNGGAIFAQNSTLTLSDILLTHNLASDGGAIYAAGVTLTIQGGSIFSNTATTGSGGGIYASGGTVGIQQAAQITHNNAGKSGGGLAADGSTVTIGTATNISDNHASGGVTEGGGGLFVVGSTLTVDGNSTLSANSASREGGAILSQSSTLLVTAASITNNSVSLGNGGGIYVSGGNASLNGGTQLTGNTAHQDGGAIYVGANGELTVAGSVSISTNQATTGRGGAIAANSATVSIDHSTLTQNTALSNGGALFAQNSAITAGVDTQITGNEALEGSGGGLHVSGGSIEISQATVAGNTADGGGGGLYADTFVIKLLGATLTGNNGGHGRGGAAYLEADEATVSNSTIENNETIDDGGGIALNDTPIATFDTNTIRNNTVRVEYTTVPVTLTEDVVIEIVEGVTQTIAFSGQVKLAVSASVADGGGLHIVKSGAVFTNNLISENSNESGEGGGIYARTSAISMTNSLIVRNSIAVSNVRASGIYAEGSSANLVHVTVADNANTSSALYTTSQNIGIYATRGITDSSSVNLVNSIVAGHDTGLFLVAGNLAALQSVAWDNKDINWDGKGSYKPAADNYRGDPQFVDRAAGDFRIKRASSAADIGVDAGVTVDFDGVERPRGFGFDAGAYEHFYTAGVHMRASAEPRFVSSGDTIEYSIELINNSATPLNGVQVSVQLPGQQALSSISGACASAPCNLGIDQGSTIIVRATASGTPPANGMLEMVTNINVTGNNFTESDSNISFTSYLAACRIVYDGVDYTSIQSAINAVDDSDDIPDIVKVSGYCGGSLKITKKLTLQGGWDTTMTTLDLANHAVVDVAGTGRALEISGDIAPTVENIKFVNGNASGKGGGPSGKDGGGAVYIRDATATLRNVIIADSTSPDYGGGLFVAELTIPKIIDSIIENNSAGDSGGGVYADGGSPELINTTVRDNSAQAGGGIYMRRSDAKIIGGTIANNSASGTPAFLQVVGFNIRLSTGGGGGIHMDESKGSISGAILEGNSAKAGGAIFADNSPGGVSGSILRGNNADGSSTIASVIVLANTAGGGGAIYAQRSDMTIENNIIIDNHASDDGGAIHIYNGSADGKINGNVINGNSSGGDGSAVYVQLLPDTSEIFVIPFTFPDQLIPFLLGETPPDPPKLTMMQNTIAFNQGGSTVHFFGESYGELVGNIFAFNKGGPAVKAQSEILPYVLLIPVPFILFIPIPYPVPYIPRVTTNYTIWYQNEGGNSGTELGGSVTKLNDSNDKDPAFKDDGYHIKRISAAYDNGKNTGSNVDIDGDSRPQGDISDMGADEYPGIGVRYVSPDGTDDGSDFCREFDKPCKSLQVAIDSARQGDLIKMAGGTYTLVEQRNGQPQMGFINKTVTIQGGYYPTVNPPQTDSLWTNNDWEDPFPDVNPTILDAGEQGRVFYILDEKKVDQEGNEIEVKPTLSGLQIKNGNAQGLNGPQGNLFPAGGAIYIDTAQTVITDVLVSNSQADYGGGIYIISSTVDIGNVTVENNQANERGGGFYVETSGEATIEDVIIRNNKAPLGAGLYLEKSAASLRLSTIEGNGDGASLAGGGLYLDGSDAFVISNTVTSNSANDGGGFYVKGSGAQIKGNTLTDNNAAVDSGGRGGGFYVTTGAAQISLNTVNQNRAGFGGGFYLDLADSLISKNTVNANTATTSGGGFYLFNTSDATVEKNTINENVANGSGENDGGGGLFFESSNAAASENTISSNQAKRGGAVYFYSFSNASLAKSTITGNVATGDGGALYLKLSNVSIEDNTITGNETEQGSGGGVYVKLSGAQLISNTIENNTAAQFGGGVFLDESGASLSKSRVNENSALSGGGIYLQRSNTASFDDVSIQRNMATEDGGGLYVLLSDIPIAGLEFADNIAGRSGGGVYLSESSAAFARNLLRGNRAGVTGGGISLNSRSHATLASNAVVDNSVLDGGTGSGIFVAGSTPTLLHTTIARNSGGDGTGITVEKSGAGTSQVSLVNTILAEQQLAVRATEGNSVTLQATMWDNNIVNFKLGAGEIFTGSAKLNFFAPAHFVDAYHIDKDSDAVGVGVLTEVSTDIDGDGRPQGNGPELGADELVVDCFAVASNDLDTTYNNVQVAIDAVDPGSEVRIAGTCTGVTNRGGLSQLAYVNKNITVRGGYTPTNWLVSYPITQPTFLDAGGQGRVFFVASGFDPTIQDLNVSNGSAVGLGGGPGGLDAGGILYARGASPTVRGMTMSGGNAHYGAGIYLQDGAATVTGNTLTDNAGKKGGAIFLRNSTATVNDNIVRSNKADDGGGIFVSLSPAHLEANEITQNAAVAAGGGIFVEASDAILIGNELSANTAQAAGGIYVDGGSPTLTRNTLNANEAQNAGGVYLSDSNATLDGNRLLHNSAGIGGAIYMQGNSPDIFNSFIAANQGHTQAGAIYILSASPRIYHNTIAANTSGDGNATFVTNLGPNGAVVEMINNIMVDHSTALTVTEGNEVTLEHTLWHNNADDWGGTGTVTENNRISGDPKFVNPTEDDYHIGSGSGAHDTGINAGITTDIDGNLRPADANFDIGADELVFLGLRVTIQTTPEPAVFDSELTILVRAVNIGNVDVSAVVSAVLPAEFVYSGITFWQVTIPKGGTWSQELTGIVEKGFVGAMDVSVSVTTDQGLTEETTVSINVEAPDHALRLVAEASPNPAPAGELLTYIVRLSNIGNLSLHPFVQASLPDVLSASSVLTWTPDSLEPGGSWSKSLGANVAPDATGNIQAVFSATSLEGASEVYTLTVPVADPALIATKRSSPNPVEAGKLVTYTITVTNGGNVDYTATITSFAPVDDVSGRPLLAPGENQTWTDVRLEAGAVWIQKVTAVVEPGYAGPLHSAVEVATDTGMRTRYTDTLEAILPGDGVTIVAIRSGDWNDPQTWDPARIPNADDVALVPAGISLEVSGATNNPISLRGLINEGDILLNCITGQPFVLNISDILRNSGTIIGANGIAEGEPGCTLEVAFTALLNSGLIRAGDGGPEGSDGGAITVQGQAIFNGETGRILGGNGSDATPPGNGGAGGDAIAFAGPGVPGLLVNQGLIRGGDGGNGGRGGDGGGVMMLSTSLLVLDGGSQQGGDGGNGDGGDGNDGNDGAVSMAAQTIWDNGVLSRNDEDFAFQVLAPRTVRGAPGIRTLLPFFFFNQGIANDTYRLIWSDTAGWPLDSLPTTLVAKKLQFALLAPFFVVPGSARIGDTNTIRVEAHSLGNLGIARRRELNLLVTSSNVSYMPSIANHSGAPARAGGNLRTYLPVVGR